MYCSKASNWKKTINNEIKPYMRTNEFLFESKPLGHKWIFKRKIKVDSTIGKYKDILVVKGLDN